MPTKSKTSASIEDIKRLYIRAGAHSRTRRLKGKETRHIEAFLLQTALLEGVLVSYGLKLLEDKTGLSALKGKRSKWYGYDNAINDLYLLGASIQMNSKDLNSSKQSGMSISITYYRKIQRQLRARCYVSTKNMMDWFGI